MYQGHIEQFLVTIVTLVSQESLIEALSQVLREMGFEAFSYGAGTVTHHGGMRAERILSTLDMEWIVHYSENHYYRDDRLVRGAILRVDPFRYEDIFAVPPASSRQLEMETRFGYKSGVVVPIHGLGVEFAILSAAARRIEPQPVITWKLLAEVQLVATTFHQHVRRLDLPKQPAVFEVPDIVLSERERQCLTWAHAGKTNRDIGVILGISENTVKKHFKSIMVKLDSTTRGQAAGRAIAMKLIEV